MWKEQEKAQLSLVQGIYIFVKIIVLLIEIWHIHSMNSVFAKWYSNEIYNSELLINVFN